MNSNRREDFPIFKQQDKKTIYLDSAATSQKPYCVLEAVQDYYSRINANPHRGAYELSIKATEAYSEAREKTRKFINAASDKEVIFTKNATEGFNLIAEAYGMNFINPGDEIVLSIMEHHSNLIPWQRVCKARGAKLVYMYIGEAGIIEEEEYKSKITDKTKLVGITHVSNVLGTINPLKEIIKHTHEHGGVVVVDGTQSVPHMAVDVRELGADFFVFSGHKMLAPMGVGVVYGREKLLEKMPPYLYGGDMVEYVYEQETTYASLPEKFEAGTQNVEAVVGLGRAIDYITTIGFDSIHAIEEELLTYALEKLRELPYIKVYGVKEIEKRSGAIAFNIDGVHPHDVASILDTYGVAIRAGNHCAQPLHRYLGVNSTCRASFYMYNTLEDVDIFIESIKNVRKWLGYGA
jgi:cysteine desulfurase/selenocysteine lyase